MLDPSFCRGYLVLLGKICFSKKYIEWWRHIFADVITIFKILFSAFPCIKCSLYTFFGALLINLVFRNVSSNAKKWVVNRFVQTISPYFRPIFSIWRHICTSRRKWRHNDVQMTSYLSFTFYSWFNIDI